MAAIKPGLDGLSDALGVDDSRWQIFMRKAPQGQIGGMVKVRVDVIEDVRARQ